MESFCRTCFQEISNIIPSTTLDLKYLKHQLICCIPEMDLRILPDVKLCKDCMEALDLTYKFKMNSREVENNIHNKQFNVVKSSVVKQEINIYTVCRICLTDIRDNNFPYLMKKWFDISKWMFCIPEVDLQTISNIKLCKDCQTTLHAIYMFKMKCLDIEKYVKGYLKLHDLVDFKHLSVMCNPLLKNERISHMEDFTIKQEEVNLVDEDVKKETTNTELDLVKNQKPQAYRCTTILKSPKSKCSNRICDNMEHLPSTSKTKFKCSECEYSTVNKFHLVLHNHTHTGERPFKCLHCEYSASQKSSLIAHMCKHTGDKPLKCSLCEYSTIRKYDLRQHILKHSGEKPLKCSICDYSTVRKFDLKRHIRKHTGEKPFKCSLCEYSAANKFGLKIHILKHTDEKPFKCSVCEYSAVSKLGLKLHIRKHTGEKPFKCSSCNYSAANKFSLKIHILIHTGEKPFKCSLCEYSASHKSGLNAHIRKHTGQKSFKCSFCEYRAIQLSHLKSHIHTHTDEKPFKCLHCDYSAARKGDLQRHIRTHTGDS